jgi:DNA-binding CsgD family transcriptional regulator
VVGCDYVVFNELDHANRTVVDEVTCSALLLCESEPFVDDEWEALWSAPFRRYKRFYGPLKVVKLSDFFPRHERRNREINWAWERNAVDSMHLYLTSARTYAANLCFESSRDFAERERIVLQLLRPHLAARYRAAELRRRLGAALAALEHGESPDCGILLIGPDGSLEFASTRAEALLERYFGDPASLPAEITGWRSDAVARPLVVSGPEGRLVVESIDSGRALVLRARSRAELLLTPREAEVMRCVAAGHSNASIAAILVVEPATVRKHLEHVFDKLGVRSRTAAVARLGLAPGPAADDQSVDGAPV